MLHTLLVWLEGEIRKRVLPAVLPIPTKEAVQGTGLLKFPFWVNWFSQAQKATGGRQWA